VPDRGSERLSDAGAELRAEFGAELGAEPSAQRISEPASALVSATASNASNAADAPSAAGTSIAPSPSGENSGGLTPWVLFTIFLFGPCEPLIPMLMYPASQANAWLVVLVASVFALVTVGTMTVAVLSMLHGISRVSLGPWQRFGHALAGLAVTGCGLAVKFGL
jgi:nickel/cobalt transporter (NicO) family protein